MSRRLPAPTCALGLALCALACVTGDIRVGEEGYAPRIPPNLVSPKPDRVVVLTDTTPAILQTFRVTQFEDANTGDTLYVRWFVDYERNPAIQQTTVRPPVPNGTSPDVRAGDQFQLTLSMLEPNAAATPHVVTVAVCDRPFDDGDTATERNRTCAPPDARLALLSWTVQVATTSAKPLREVADGR